MVVSSNAIAVTVLRRKRRNLWGRCDAVVTRTSCHPSRKRSGWHRSILVHFVARRWNIQLSVLRMMERSWWVVLGDMIAVSIGNSWFFAYGNSAGSGSGLGAHWSGRSWWRSRRLVALSVTTFYVIKERSLGTGFQGEHGCHSGFFLGYQGVFMSFF